MSQTPIASEADQAFDVIIVGFETRAESPAAGLHRLFGLDQVAAEALLRELPATVRRSVNQVRAEYFRRALVSIGARVELREQLPARGPSQSLLDGPTAAQPLAASHSAAPTSRGSSIEHDLLAPIGSQRTLLQGSAPLAPLMAANDVAVKVPLPPPRPASQPLENRTPGADSAWGELDRAKPSTAPGAARRLASVAPPSAQSGAATSQRPPAASVPPKPASMRPKSSPPVAAQRPAEVPLLARWEQPDLGRFSEPVPHRSPQFDVAASLSAGAREHIRGVSAPVPGPAKPAAMPAAKDAQRVSVRAPAQAPRPPMPAAPLAVAAAPESFWEGIPECIGFPWSGASRVWLLSIGLWAVAAHVVTAFANWIPFVGMCLSFVASVSVVALCADFHRHCMWSTANGDFELDDGPDFTSDRVTIYLRSGVKLALFMLVSQLPLVAWIVHETTSGTGAAEHVWRSPIFWLLASAPGCYWPMAMAIASLRNDLAAVWLVMAGARAIVRAPLEYAAILFFGIMAFALPWLMFVIVGKAASLPTLYFAAAAGVPLAVSHAVMGALTGTLMRARPDIFE